MNRYGGGTIPVPDLPFDEQRGYLSGRVFTTFLRGLFETRPTHAVFTDEHPETWMPKRTVFKELVLGGPVVDWGPANAEPMLPKDDNGYAVFADGVAYGYVMIEYKTRFVAVLIHPRDWRESDMEADYVIDNSATADPENVLGF